MAIDRVREQHEQWISWALAVAMFVFLASRWFDGRPWQKVFYEDALWWLLALQLLPWRGVVFYLQLIILSLFLWIALGDPERGVLKFESIKFLEWIGIAVWIFNLSLLVLLAFKKLNPGSTAK